jgi:ABC-type polar amino acid transport system ATPase subunit
MGFARSAAQRFVLMDDGRIVEAVAPERFFSAPQSDVVDDEATVAGQPVRALRR